MVLNQIGDIQYHVTKLVWQHWQKNSIEKMKKSNSDRVYIVDGIERTGKSLWTIQQAGVLDRNMFKDVPTFLSRICFTPEEFFTAVRHTRNGVIIFDEAFRGFSSRAAMSKVNKKLIQALMEMGQNNNIVFIVLPSFFMLDMYPAMLRSHGLFNIYIDRKSGQRRWRGYNRYDKNFIYQNGAKKGWAYLKKSFFQGTFYGKFPGGDEFERAYDAKKRKALITMDKEEDDLKEQLWKKFSLGFLYYLSVHGLRIPAEESADFFNEALHKLGAKTAPATMATYARWLRQNNYMPEIDKYLEMAKKYSERSGIEVADYDNSFVPEPPKAEVKILEVEKEKIVEKVKTSNRKTDPEKLANYLERAYDSMTRATQIEMERMKPTLKKGQKPCSGCGNHEAIASNRYCIFCNNRYREKYRFEMNKKKVLEIDKDKAKKLEFPVSGVLGKRDRGAESRHKDIEFIKKHSHLLDNVINR